MNIAERTIQQIGEGIFQTAVGRYDISFTGGDKIRTLRSEDGNKYTPIQLAFFPHKSHADERVVFEVIRRLCPNIEEHLVIPGKKTYWFKKETLKVRDVFINPKSALKRGCHNFMIENVPSMAFPGCKIVPLGLKSEYLGSLIELINSGERTVALVAPEGTRDAHKQLNERTLKKGTPKTSIQTGSPIIPVGIIGMGEILPKGKLIPKGLFRRNKLQVAVQFGEPIYPEDFDNDMDKINNALMERYLQMDLE